MRKIFLFLLFASSLFASHSGEIYTYGYFEFVKDNLMALSSLVTQSNDILFKIIFSLAIFIFLIKNLGNPQKISMLGLEFAKFTVMITLVQQLFLTAPDDDNHAYAVVDRITTQTQIVRQVPKGIGEILSLFTRLEDAIMIKMETNFSTPSSISYRNAGLGFSFSTPMEIFQQTSLDSNTLKTFNNYYENCKMLADFSDGTQDIARILDSKTLRTDLSTNSTLLTVVYTESQPDGYVTECKTAWTIINSRINNESASQLGVLAATRGMSVGAYSSKAELASSTILGASVSAQDQLKEAMFRNMTLSSVQKTAASLGMSQDQLAKNKSIAEMSMVNDAMLSNLMAQGMIPVMKALVLSFIIGLSWILAILSIITLNPSYIRFLVTLNVWLMLWSPLYTILNYAMDIMVANSMSGFNSGIDINNQMPIYTILGAKLAMLSKLVWAIPMLAFAVAKGSDHAMVSFVGGMGAGAAAGAMQAGRQEIQSAQSGKAEYTDFKEKFTDRIDSGGQTRSALQNGANGSTYSVENIDAGGGNGFSNISNIGTGNKTSVSGFGEVNANANGLSSQATAAAKRSMSESQEKVQQIAESYGEKASTVASEAIKAGESTQATDQFAKKYGLSKTEAEQITEATKKASSEAFKSLENYGSKLTADEAKAVNTAVGYEGVAKIGTPDWFGSAVGASMRVSENGSIELKGASGASMSFDANSEVGKSLSKEFSSSLSQQFSQDQGIAMNYASAINKNAGMESSVQEAKQRELSEAFTSMESAKSTYSSAQELSSSVGQDKLNAAMKNWLADPSNEASKDLFDSNGNFKDANAREQGAMLVQAKLDSWTQSVNGHKDFANFMRDYGDSDVNTNGVNNSGFKSDIKETIDGKMESNKDIAKDVNPENIKKDAEERMKEQGDDLSTGEQSVDATTGVNKDEVVNNIRTPLKIEDADSKQKEVQRATENLEQKAENKYAKTREAAVNKLDNQNTEVEKSHLLDTAKTIDGATDSISDFMKFMTNNNTAEQYDTKTEAFKAFQTDAQEKAYSQAIKSGLIKEGFVTDKINTDLLKSQRTEDLVNIYERDQNNSGPGLVNSSEYALRAELSERGALPENKKSLEKDGYVDFNTVNYSEIKDWNKIESMSPSEIVRMEDYGNFRKEDLNRMDSIIETKLEAAYSQTQTASTPQTLTSEERQQQTQSAPTKDNSPKIGSLSSGNPLIIKD